MPIRIMALADLLVLCLKIVATCSVITVSKTFRQFHGRAGITPRLFDSLSVDKIQSSFVSSLIKLVASAARSRAEI